MSRFVLDASVTAAWLLDDEGGVRANAALARLETEVALVPQLSVRTDTEPRVTTAFALARRHGLSIYDAVYLELAQRSDAPLATLDQAMSRAARATGLALIEA